MQFLRQIAYGLRDVLGLSYAFLVFNDVGRRRPSTGFLSLSHSLSLSVDHRQTVLQLVPGPLTAPLDLGSHMQHMPDISLVALQPLQLAERFLNGSPSITDTALAEQSLLVQIPPHQRPTFPIHRHWGQGGPHLSALHINHIEIGFSSLTAVLFIQGPGTWRTGLRLSQPSLRTLPRFLRNTDNASQADASAKQL